MKCNLCGGGKFVDYRGRPNEICFRCDAKARHRVALVVYEQHLFPQMSKLDGSVLHLAPEKALSGILERHFNKRYYPADAAPERYPHVNTAQMFFPDDFAVIPDATFAGIIHNHVLEHIPGNYQDHLTEFVRILKSGGRMIFSVPGPYLQRETEQGGEHFSSDEERLEKFLQEDHFKIFGADFVEFLNSMEGGKLIDDGITDALRTSISVRPGKARFFIWQKN